MVKTEEKKESNFAKLDTLAGNEMIVVRSWHISIFASLISFVVLFVFFYTFQPQTLLDPSDFVIGTQGSDFKVGNTTSDEDKNNKTLSDRGRTIVFAWALGLGVLVGILVHFLLVYLN